jgi:hypothetical protein
VGVGPQNSCSGGSSGGGGGSGGALVLAPILPNFVTPLVKGLRILELPRVDQISDIARQLVETEDRLDLLRGGRLQGVELVTQDRGLVAPETWVVQPFSCSLGGAEAVTA